MIVARQNGKGSILEARVLAGLFLLGERLILYSAHEFKTAVEMFRRIEELISGNAAFRRRVKRVDRTRGEEGVELLTGQRLRFVARSTGSGRGFTGDLNIWDECQNLSNASVDALMPTMSARPNPQLWYAGSAPDKDLAPCDQITRVRRRALSGEATRLAYFEWSAELCGRACGQGCTEHDAPGDPATWAKTNPGLGIRVSPDHIATEHESMSAAGFARERLSVGNYPSEDSSFQVISEQFWTDRLDPHSRIDGRLALAIAVTPTRSHAAIAAVGWRPDGDRHAEVIDHRAGSGWVVRRVVQLKARHDVCAVAVGAFGYEASLIVELEEAGVEVFKMSSTQAAAAFGAFYDGIVPADEEADEQPVLVTDENEDELPRDRTPIWHLDQAPLSIALAGAQTRPLAGGQGWDWRQEDVDLSPLRAATNAVYAFAATAGLSKQVVLEGAIGV